MTEEEPSVKDKLLLKILVKRMKKKKKKLLKKKHDEAITLAKTSIIQCIDFMLIEDDNKELSKEDILTMNDDKVLELFEMVVEQLENTYLGRETK